MKVGFSMDDINIEAIYSAKDITLVLYGSSIFPSLYLIDCIANGVQWVFPIHVRLRAAVLFSGLPLDNQN